MSTYRIGVMRGDGIGPEIVQACVTIFESAMCLTPTISYELVECPMGLDAIRRYGSALPDESRALLKTCDCWIMGPHDNASYPAEERKKHRNQAANCAIRSTSTPIFAPVAPYPASTLLRHTWIS